LILEREFVHREDKLIVIDDKDSLGIRSHDRALFEKWLRAITSHSCPLFNGPRLTKGLLANAKQQM
jgi:hypothetical protein